VDEFSDAGRIRRDGVFGRQFVYVAEFVLEVLVFSGETGQSQARGGCFIRTAWQPPSVPNVRPPKDPKGLPNDPVFGTPDAVP
jgi:hypothetical protein